MECRELDTMREKWNKDPRTKDGELNPNVIFFKDATKREIDWGFEALVSLQKRDNVKRLCFFLFLGHGMTETGL